jgi:hypothetical protein
VHNFKYYLIHGNVKLEMFLLFFSGAPLYGRPLALTTNIRLGWKGFPGTNILAYYENPLITSVKSFIRFAPGPIVIKNYGRKLRIVVIS